MYAKRGDPTVTIAEQESNKLRIYLSDVVLHEMQSLYIDFDLEAMTLRPVNDSDTGVLVRKLTARQQIYVSGIPDMKRYIGRYEAERHGNVWRLNKIVPEGSGGPSIEPDPVWPYGINFPSYEIVNGYFKML